MTYKIHNGNNCDILKEYPDCHIDAIVTDPPYGIEFLGKDWDKNTGTIETWKECLRVLKPGGHLLAFSSARTYHILATNIQEVGFDIRDQIMWLYASGFPKAQDIGKAIDKRGGMVSNNEDTKSLKTILAELFEASGKTKSQINQECGFNATGYLRQYNNETDGWGYALPLNDKWQTLKQVLGCGDEYDKYFTSSEREVVGTKESGCFDKDFETYTIGARSKTVDITQPATKQANKWHGWKTAVKPAHEPIVLARKPFKGSTIDNVLKNGVGALNIDATRIESEPFDYCADGLKRTTYSQSEPAKWNDSNKQMIRNEQGRYPSNVIGEVAEDYQKYFYCPKVSRKERHCGFEQTNIPNTREMLEQIGGYYCDKDGNKTTPDQHTNLAYVPGQSIIQAHGVTNAYEKIMKNKDPLSHIPTIDEMIEIMGGHYTGKDRQEITLPHLSGNIKCNGIIDEYTKWCKNKDPLSHIPTNPEGMWNVDGTGVQYNSNKYKSVGNNHPTVKPVALMKYLIKLVTPPNSIVLDPFMGSGSTGMAAEELGHEFIGIELDANYCDIASKRITAWNKPQSSNNNYGELFYETT